ncbi:MAG: hypothetical protein K2X11_16615, partial [Acetobacteraceae bacterium]|nr:hypothetical protein [Acetobacteraceae bacterium]
ARLAAGAVARACGTQAGALGHSGFGDVLPAGEVTRLDLDAFLRFDGALHRAPLDAAARTALRPRVNQEEGAPFAARIGDFAWMEPAEGGSLAVNGWVRGRAAHFLGSGALPFEEVPGLRLKAVVEAALRGPMAASP